MASYVQPEQQALVPGQVEPEPANEPAHALAGPLAEAAWREAAWREAAARAAAKTKMKRAAKKAAAVGVLARAARSPAHVVGLHVPALAPARVLVVARLHPHRQRVLPAAASASAA